MRLSAYDTYVLFLSLKNHFTQEKYDYFKYKGKIKNISKNSFSMSKDRFLYQRICREYDESVILDFFVANFIKGKVWIRDFLEEEAKDDYMSYMKRKQAITYNFDNELSRALSKVENVQSLFRNNGGQYPEIINLYLNNEISIETMAILNSFIGFSDRFDQKIGKDDVLWSKIRLLCLKVQNFLEYDRSKIKNILKDKINATK